MLHLGAAIVATSLSFVHARRLGLGWSGLWKLVRKSTSLALCYVGFCDRYSLVQSIRAGESGFLSAVYDAVTDWNPHPKRTASELRFLVARYSEPDVADAVCDMYRRDISGELGTDGLERGCISTRVIMAHMSVLDAFRRSQSVDVDLLGVYLQVADDILDIDCDTARHQHNCLQGPRRGEYLRMLVTFVDETDLKAIFPRGTILRMILLRCRTKGRRLLAAQGPI